MADIVIEGGCFCGDVRYRATESPESAQASICVCSNCRHASASPLPTYVSFGTDNFETDRFRFIKGQPVRYRYTSEMDIREGDDTGGTLPVGHLLWSERFFCSRCGTQIAHIHEGLTDVGGDNPRVLEISVMACTLDNPDAFPPRIRSGGLEGQEDMLSWIKLRSLDEQPCLVISNSVKSHNNPSKT